MPIVSPYAAETYGVEPINFDDHDDPAELIIERTDRRGVDCSIDAVGFEAKGSTLETVLTTMKLEGSSGKALRQEMAATRRGGIVSVPGVYAGFIHSFLFGDAFEKGLTFKGGQTHAQRYMPELLHRISKGELRLKGSSRSPAAGRGGAWLQDLQRQGRGLSQGRPVTRRRVADESTHEPGRCPRRHGRGRSVDAVGAKSGPRARQGLSQALGLAATLRAPGSLESGAWPARFHSATTMVAWSLQGSGRRMSAARMRKARSPETNA